MFKYLKTHQGIDDQIPTPVGVAGYPSPCLKAGDSRPISLNDNRFAEVICHTAALQFVLSVF